MKHDYMHMQGQGRAPGISRNPEVMVKLHMVSVDITKIVRQNFWSLRHFYLLVHLIMLMHDYINKTELFS